MKKLTLGIAINFLLINLCFAQRFESNDFLELGFRTGNFTESSFLETTDFQNQLADPNTDIEGLLASPTGRNYSAKFRYGKKLFPNFHLISEVGLTKLNEEVVCFCVVCDKPYEPFIFATFYAVNTGLGARYQVIKINRLSFSIDAIGSFSFLTNESDVQYYGFLVQPFVEYQLSKNLSINLKYGYEQSFNDYQKKEKYVEFAINYQLSKKG